MYIIHAYIGLKESDIHIDISPRLEQSGTLKEGK